MKKNGDMSPIDAPWGGLRSLSKESDIDLLFFYSIKWEWPWQMFGINIWEKLSMEGQGHIFTLQFFWVNMPYQRTLCSLNSFFFHVYSTSHKILHVHYKFLKYFDFINQMVNTCLKCWIKNIWMTFQCAIGGDTLEIYWFWEQWT